MPSYPESETATSPTNSNSYPLSFMSMAPMAPAAHPARTASSAHRPRAVPVAP